MKRLAVAGSGDLGQLIAHHATRSCGMALAGFFDDFRPRGEQVGLGPVLGGTADIEAAFERGEFDEALVGVGYRHFGFRQALYERLRAARIPLATLVHPSCYVDPTATLGAGAVLLPGCVVDRGSEIGENVLLNVGCTIAHDSSLGAHSFLGPAVNVAGFVRVEPRVFLGIGTTIIDNRRIASGCQTGAGAVVTQDLDAPGLYVGVPARLKKPLG